MLRASVIALALGLGSGPAWSQTPSSQLGAVPKPPWASPPASPPAASPPVAPAPQSPVAPFPAPAQAPTVILVQVPAVAPIAASAPVMLPTPQSPIAYSPYVNPFVVQQAAPQPQQGIGTVALIGATLIADNPWIIDRILAHWGEHLHRRGMPVLRLAPPGSAVPPPAASSPVVAFGQPGAFTVISGPQHKTRFGRWFWGN